MKYELEPYNRNVPDQILLDDLRRVAHELGKSYMTLREPLESPQRNFLLISRNFGPAWVTSPGTKISHEEPQGSQKIHT